MRIGRAHGRLVVVDGDGVVDVAAVSGGRFGTDPDQVFAVWDRFAEWADGQAGPGARTGPLAAGELGAPVLTPSQVFGIGLNYREHAAESGAAAADAPPVFTKFRSCLTGPYAAVELPSDRVDWEVELVAVLGRPADRVPEEKAWSCVAGLMVGQDLSERTVQRPGAAVLAGEVVSRLRADRAVAGDPRRAAGSGRPAAALLGGRPGAAGRPDQGHDLLRSRAGGADFRGVPHGAGRRDLHQHPGGGGDGRKPPEFLRPGTTLVSTIEGLGELRNALVAGPGFPAAGR